MHVHFGKSDNARRTVPLSPRCAALLDIRRGNRREHGPFRRRPGAGTWRRPRSRGNTGKPSGIAKAEGFTFYPLHHNLGTAVAEPDGRLVRFHPRFLGFAREYNFMPRACNPASGWEKGRWNAAASETLRQNFRPLREFTDLHDVNRQARQWLAEVANQRLHHETRQRPSIGSAPTPYAHCR